jgi:DNA-binding NarL/FixJ family response regulator
MATFGRQQPRPIGLKDELSPTELLTLRFIAIGLKTQEIADVRGVEYETVKTQSKTILWKMDARNRTLAVSLAWERGLIDRNIQQQTREIFLRSRKRNVKR